MHAAKRNKRYLAEISGLSSKQTAALPCGSFGVIADAVQMQAVEEDRGRLADKLKDAIQLLSSPLMTF